MQYLVTGAGGQLGRAVVEAVSQRNHAVVGAGHAELAVEDERAVRERVEAVGPDVIVHCAAWTNVDGCEGDPARADLINGRGTANIASAAASVGAKLVYVSTDFVFDGTADVPYPVTAPTCPVSAYGRSKLLGEQAVLELDQPAFWIVRTSWVFGPGGSNFPRAILNRARSGEPLRVVTDQRGAPTMTRDLAGALLDLADSEASSGIYHASNEGSCSWHEFACELLAAAGLGEIEVGRMSSAELARPAARPAYSVLDCSRLTAVRGCALPPYSDAVQRYLSEEMS